MFEDGGQRHVMDWGKIDKTYRKKIITRALDEQLKNLFNIISGNFQNSKQQIDELKKELNELKHSIEQ